MMKYILRTFLLFLLSLLLFCMTGYGQVGTPDSSFGTNGILNIEQGAMDIVTDMQNTSAGGLYIFGAYTRSDTSFASIPYIHKIHSDGTTDESFGNDGFIYPDYPEGSTSLVIWDGRVLANGEVVLASISGLEHDTVYYHRYHSDGTPDTSVSDEGWVYALNELSEKTTDNMSVDSEGRVYWSGSHNSGALFGTVERINADGTYDEDFEVIDQLSSYFFQIHRAEVFRDTSIYVNGISIGGTETLWSYVKMDSSGSIDSTFGTNGEVAFSSFDFAGDERRQDMHFDASSEQIFAVHSLERENLTSSPVFLNSFTSDGIPDDTFDQFQIPSIGFEKPYFTSITTQQSGTNYLLLGGYEQDSTEFTPTVRRYRMNGMLDTTFGTNGRFLDRNLTFELSGRFLQPIQPRILINSDGSLYYSYTYSTPNFPIPSTESRIIKLHAEMETATEDPGRHDIPWTMTNPQSDHNWEYTLPESVRGAYSISIFDGNGKLMKKKTFDATPHKTEGAIDVPAGLDAGMYFVLLQTDEGRSVKKMVFHP